MSELSLHLETRDFDRRWRQLELQISDLRGFWPLVVPIFVRWMREQFDTQGAWGGSRWAPLAASTVAWKAKHHPGRGILYETGALRRAASQPARDVTPRSLTLRIEDPKAAYHQYGTRRMPARPIIPGRLSVAAQHDLERAADEYVRNVVRRLGLS